VIDYLWIEVGNTYKPRMYGRYVGQTNRYVKMSEV